MQAGKLKKAKERLAPFYGLAIPLAYAIVLLVISQFHDTFEEWDGVVQLFAGREIFAGIGYRGTVAQRWPPLYPLLIGLTSQFMPGFEGAKLVSMIASVILACVTYAFAMELSNNRRVALLAQSFLVLNPMYIVSSIQAENHMLDSLFFVSALVLFVKALKQPTPKRLLATGLVASLAALSRTTSYALVPVFTVALFIFLDAKQALKASAVFLLSFILTCLPWWYTNTRANGAPIETMLYLNIGWRVVGEGGQKWWWDTHTNFNGFLDIFAANPHGYLENLARNVYSSGRILITTAGALAPFVVPSAFDAVISLKPRYWVVLFGELALFTLLVSQAAIYNEVFLSWAVIFCILSVMFLGKYLAQVGSRYPVLKKHRFSTIVIVILLFAGLTLTSLNAYRYISWDDYDNGQLSDHRAITAAIKEHDSDIALKQVMAIHPARAYYLDSGYSPCPLYYEGSIAGLVSYKGIKMQVNVLGLRFPSTTTVQEARADYLIYDVALRSYLPQFTFLLDPKSDKIPKNFRLVYQSEQAVVYEILWQ